MANSHLLIIAMARQCKRMIRQREASDSSLPPPLQPKHLEWMCSQIEQRAETGPANKLHRWLGFIQSAMLAHRILDLDGLKAMFDEAKRSHRDASDDLDDLLDHLDPASSFEFDLGGQG